MVVTVSYVKDAIKNGSIEQISEIMELFRLSKDSKTSITTTASRDIAKCVLSFAAAEDYCGNIEPEMVYEIIERVSTKINLFDLVRFVVSAAKIEDTDFEILSEELRVSLEKDKASNETIDAIYSLDRPKLIVLLSFIACGKAEYLSLKFNLPIIKRIYDSMLIPAHLFLSFLAICLCDSD